MLLTVAIVALGALNGHFYFVRDSEKVRRDFIISEKMLFTIVLKFVTLSLKIYLVLHSIDERLLR